MANFDILQATQYRDDLEHIFDALPSSPRIGREYLGTNQTIRIHFHLAHVIAYVIEPTAILIVRILPIRLDWKEVL